MADDSPQCGIPSSKGSKVWIVTGRLQPVKLYRTEYQNPELRSQRILATQQRSPNIQVLTGTTVTKINCSRDGAIPRAVSVSAEIWGSKTTIEARKEIILCAGTVQSPQILELSGIGKRERLQGLGIDVIVGNPNVGENLQDHVSTAPCFVGLPTLIYLRPANSSKGGQGRCSNYRVTAPEPRSLERCPPSV